MKSKIFWVIFVTFIFLGIYIEDFFLSSIWTVVLLGGFVYAGGILIISAQFILSWIIEKIHSFLIWVFNPEIINSKNFYEIEQKIEERAKWYLGIPYALGVLYLFLWLWDVV